MKAISPFAQPTPKQTARHYRLENRCHICGAPITDEAYYCHKHAWYRRRLNKQLNRWLELQDKLDRGLITLDEAKVIKVWP